MNEITLNLLTALLFTACQKTPVNLQLPSMTGDSMVLQQKTNARIWGKATTGPKISVTPEWGSAENATAG